MSDAMAHPVDERLPVQIPLLEAFAGHDVRLEGPSDPFAEARLTAPVGAALMAALDWMSGAGGATRVFRARLDDTCVAIEGRPGDLRGVRAAGEILALTGGNLHPVPGAGSRGLWRLRVPLAVEVPSYLMIERAGVRMALPWTSVLAVIMAPADALRASRLGAPLLPLPESDSETAGDLPVVLLAHGLKRAYLAADRLVWRLRAEPLPVEQPPPDPALIHPAQADDGETYWVANPARLLASVEPPPIPEEAIAPPESEPQAPPAEPARTAGTEPVATPIEPSTPVHSTVTPPPEHAPPQSTAPLSPPLLPGEATAFGDGTRDPGSPLAGATGPVSAGPTRLTADHVEPLEAPPAPAAPDVTREQPAPRPQAPLRQVLLAEDSFIARVFLGRMLEQRGFRVVPAASAAELIELLPGERWAVVCVDVELGDGGGAPLLRQVRETLARLAATETRGPARIPPVVALVRDARDVGAARAGGVALTLLKPFDTAEVESLLGGLDAGMLP